MSITVRGKAKTAEREQLAREYTEQRDKENHAHTIQWFFRDFYRDHYKPNPAYTGAHGGEPHYIHDPPLPEIEGWHVLNPKSAYAYGDPHMTSEFVCEGLRYRCVWQFKGTGGDRAYWDDGWWPDWYVLTRETMRALPWIKRDKWVLVYGPENVAEAVGA